MPRNSSDNPWVIHDQREVYDTPWINVREYDVTNPGGNPNIYGVVHFKNKAIGVVPIENDIIWLVGQTRFPLGQYSWELPEGGCPEGESPIDTAHRELREEAGLTASSMTPFLQMHLSNSVCDEWAEVFLAKGLSEVEADPEDTEDITVKKLPLEAFFDWVRTGKITDSITVAAAYKLMYLKATGAL